MLEADAKTKLCPIMSTRGAHAPCAGSGCVLWNAEESGPVTVKVVDRKKWDATGWSTNGDVGEDGTLVFYRAPAGHCRAGATPPGA